MPFPSRAVCASDRFTAVVCQSGDRLRHEVLFGHSFFYERIAKRRLTIWYFAPGDVFAYVRQTPDFGNPDDPFPLYFGEERLIVARAVQRGKPCQPINGVKPGGKILLDANGREQIDRVRRAIKELEARGFDPADVSPVFWRRVQKRFGTYRSDPSYGWPRHAAFLLRRRIGL
jgi:hypothetical protein